MLDIKESDFDMHNLFDPFMPLKKTQLFIACPPYASQIIVHKI